MRMLGKDVREVKVGATILQVAESAGVSASTVSRTFSHPEMIRAETRGRVMTAARELGYVPPHRGMPAGRTGNLGLIVPDIANPFFAPFVKAAQNQAMHSDLAVFLADTDEDSQAEERALQHLVKQVDGVILCSPRLPNEAIHRFADSTEMVLVNREVDGIPSVLLDTGDGMRQAVDHLAALGHGSVAYLSGPSSSWSNTERRRGLRGQASRHGMQLHFLGPYISNFQAGLQAADSVLTTGSTAVVAYDDVMALGVLARFDDRSIHVPKEMSVVGCDDIDAAAMFRPSLTTVTARCDVAGRSAVDLLVRCLTNMNVGMTSTTLPTQLLVRESTGPRC